MTLVRQNRDDRAAYGRRAALWEGMYFSRSKESRGLRELAEQEGKAAVRLPTAFNVVHLGMRLVNSTPKVDVPSTEATSDSDDKATRRKRWLLAMLQRINAQQQVDLVNALTWQALVRGRFCFEVKWIRDSIPERLRKRRFPIMIRPLDPLTVGVVKGPFWTEFAYVWDEDVPRWKLKKQFPNLKFGEKRARRVSEDEEDIRHNVIDFWWTDPGDGTVWNAVVIDGAEFAKKPAKTDYPEIPIYEGMGDTSYSQDEEFKGLSILFPVEGTLEYHNSLVSQIATALHFYFWPHIAVSNEAGRELPDNIEVKPGETVVYPWGTRIEAVQMQPNIPLADKLLMQVDTVQQQATFPGVLYGEAPGQIQAGYAVNVLAQAASGRMRMFQTNLEMGLQHAFGLALALVEQFGGKDGVHAWGLDDADGMYEVALKPEDVEGYYECKVKVTGQTIQDDLQKAAVVMQLVQAGIMSKHTARDQLPFDFPTDEQRRVELEQVLSSDELRQKTLAAALVTYFPDSWEAIVGGTPLEPVAYAMEGIEPPAPPPPPPGMGGPPGPPMPPGMPPPGPGPGGPMGGMPPEMMGGPPGMMGGGPPLQPDAIATAVGGGIPPEAQGQLTPELMGLPADTDPALFARMMGSPMSPEEELRLLAEGGD